MSATPRPCGRLDDCGPCLFCRKVEADPRLRERFGLPPIAGLEVPKRNVVKVPVVLKEAVVPRREGGVGTALKDLLAAFGIQQGGCGCLTLMVEMDEAGVSFVKERRDSYLGRFHANAQTFGWAKTLTATLKGGVLGIVRALRGKRGLTVALLYRLWKADDRLALLLDEAIARAEAKENAPPVPREASA
jgi:hypothetical protein